MTLVAGPRVSASCRGGPYGLNCSTIEVWRKVGEWLSLVEHLVRDQGVGGSNPLSPTNSFNDSNLIFMHSLRCQGGSRANP
jgi:hypothetical protein